MRWPWVSRKRLERAQLLAVIWEGSASRYSNKSYYWMNLLREEQDARFAERQKLETAIDALKEEAKKGKGPFIEDALDSERAPERGRPESTSLREVWPVSEYRVTISNTVETGRMDGKLTPSGAAPGGKS